MRIEARWHRTISVILTLMAAACGSSVEPLLDVPAGLALGGDHSCALMSDGPAGCWGWNTKGQLGIGSSPSVSANPSPVRTSIPFDTIVAGRQHTCGLTNAGAAYCWGYNAYGQLGDGTQNDRPFPAAVNTSLRFATLTAGSYHTCGVTLVGAAHCWGMNDGALGDGTTTQRLVPVAVTGGLAFRAIDGGGGSTCGLTTSNGAWCWGNNETGQLGTGTTTSSLVPVAVTGGRTLRGSASATCSPARSPSPARRGAGATGPTASLATARRRSPRSGGRVSARARR